MCVRNVNLKKIFRILLSALLSILCAVTLFACGSETPTPDIKPHLISTPDKDPQRPIDDLEEMELTPVKAELTDKQYNSRIDELYQVVADFRKKPVFPENDPVKPVYDAARAVLDRYVLNAWHSSADGAYRIVHTIHDWLVGNIDYDFELYDEYNSGVDVGGDPAFDIDGVFLNKRAVCDGLSRALAFMCAIEGIDCIRVTGTFIGVPHAWNKVKIGGAWYNIDVTADAANYTVDNSSKYKKQLAHGYFLLSDKTYESFSPTGIPSDAHLFGAPYAKAETDYDYYADSVVDVGGETYTITVTSQSDLNSLFYDIGRAKGKVGKIELKLDFPEKDGDSTNMGDIYKDEIKEAYTRLNDPDFKFSDKSVPYFRYPNGVYLFLMYA